jgi:hypothetical protein
VLRGPFGGVEVARFLAGPAYEPKALLIFYQGAKRALFPTFGIVVLVRQDCRDPFVDRSTVSSVSRIATQAPLFTSSASAFAGQPQYWALRGSRTLRMARRGHLNQGGFQCPQLCLGALKRFFKRQFFGHSARSRAPGELTDFHRNTFAVGDLREASYLARGGMRLCRKEHAAPFRHVNGSPNSLQCSIQRAVARCPRRSGRVAQERIRLFPLDGDSATDELRRALQRLTLRQANGVSPTFKIHLRHVSTWLPLL